MTYYMMFGINYGTYKYERKSYCRGYLLRDMRTSLMAGGPGGVVNYNFLVGNGERVPSLGVINRIVRRICPYLRAPVLEVEELDHAPLKFQVSSWHGPFVRFHIDPGFLQYGWAINGLLMGYLRQHVWKYQTIAHRYDIRDLRTRLEHWWENDWATKPDITWYFNCCLDSQASALHSVFSYKRNHPTVPMMQRSLGYDHPIVLFGHRMNKLGLCGKWCE